MIFYHIWSLIKIIIGLSVIYLLYNYINIYQDPLIAIGFWFFWLFLVTWWVSFYIFFILQKFFSKLDNLKISSKSYKLSLLFWLFLLINLSFVILEERNKIIWLAILIIFIILHIVTMLENE